jgi:putative transposase
MNANQAIHNVRMMSRLLQVSASGFYDWKDRALSQRARRDIELTGCIHRIHRGSKGSYGAPMIHAELAQDHDIRVGCKRVARLMRRAGLKGVYPKRFVITTTPGVNATPSNDLVARQFKAQGPDRLWVADITYVPTWEGFVYLAVVLDVWSRKVVGWAMQDHMQTELVLEALNSALAQRQPLQVVHHSDHGCQYTSYAFGQRCQQMNVVSSMGTVGDAYDNAMAESFFATLERELLSRSRFKTHAEAKTAVFEWLEGWYNLHRRHSSLGRISPITFERRHAEHKAA